MNRITSGVLALVLVFAVGTRVKAQAPDNDDCDNPLFVGQVQTPFNNIDATTDGMDEPNQCNFFGFTNVEADVWFCYAAECTGFTSISVCYDLSGYDTKLAVYRGCGCPKTEADACSDDDCGTSSRQSRVVVAVVEGEQLGIRVGGFDGDQGEGILNIFCGQEDDFITCTEFAGECTEANATRGCNDPDCCQNVCTLDPYCCDVDWDSTCVELAEGLCGDGFENCGSTGDFDGDGQSTLADFGFFDTCVGASLPGSLGCSAFDFNADHAINVFDYGGVQTTFGMAARGSCSEGHNSPGCSSRNCCQAVCAEDPFCCLVTWDGTCAENAPDQTPCTCIAAEGDCDGSNGSPGCDDEVCCVAVCAEDSFCCDFAWDTTCADLAAGLESCGGG